MSGPERPASRLVRVGWVVAAWIVGVPMAIGLWSLMGWLSLLIVLPALWTTWDYLRRGDMFGAVDGASRMGAFLPGAWRRRDDR